MNVEQRIDLLVRLGKYMQSDAPAWQQAKHMAYLHNKWFIPEFIDTAVDNIVKAFLQKDILEDLVQQYDVKDMATHIKTVGIVMAGNLPLVGFHDFICVFISGNKLMMKLSSKDEVLLRHVADQLIEWNSEVASVITFAEMLKNCDAYIATGSNNTSRYFDYYFARYPHIIRKNRTSVAVLDGTETEEEIALLANDIQLYFGLGCRNVTKLFVPEGYNFVPLLEALKAYEYLMDYNKYKNNFDYQLALLIMGNKYYMNNDSIILTENANLFAPVAQLNYSYYNSKEETIDVLKNNTDVQCIVGHGCTPFGQAQQPCITSYADGVDTMAFLMELNADAEL
ncbi:acyl-CoA reductase [Ilyomonas limi]|uniref:Acyl-CoA reductase n=1 Tax=Ilyomonas limi TaxID=2575867 RepID=A0A4U3KX97_9BACT|nr:acyl-CoA reductase [Ilyomonas limi]TKK65707.1 acyl-CoA reductase [Ilyomonas limi]